MKINVKCIAHGHISQQLSSSCRNRSQLADPGRSAAVIDPLKCRGIHDYQGGKTLYTEHNLLINGEESLYKGSNEEKTPVREVAQK